MILLALALAAQLELQPLVSGLERPVQIVSSRDSSGDLFIAEQAGRIVRLHGGRLDERPFLDLGPLISCCDNGGLLSLVFDPFYEQNGRLFVLYVNLDGDTVIARYTRSASDPPVADPASGRPLLVIEQPRDNVPNHHGGTLLFGPDGHLYASIGDGGAFREITNRAQETHHFLGKLLRLDVRGEAYAIPADNPFAGVPGARGEIWSYGLRNPWRVSFDRATGDLFIADVGQDRWEEVNVTTLAEARGANFGWPIREGNHCIVTGCSNSGLTPPVLEYSRAGGCSITGGFVYRGHRWPQLHGLYFYGDWCTGNLWAARQTTPGQWESELLLDTDLAIVSFGEDDDGELYVVDTNGGIYTLTVQMPKRRAVRK